MKIKSVFILSVFLFISVAQISLADTYTVKTVGAGGDAGIYGPYQASNGGEFTLQITSDNLKWVLNYYKDGVTKNVIDKNNVSTAPSFQTFCLEETEYIYPNAQHGASISLAAHNGGNGGATNGYDTISKGTAWLYYQFANGTLAGYNYSANRKDSAKLLQQAIWGLEDEVSLDKNNIFVKAVLGQFSGATDAEKIRNAKANSSGDYGVSVLNLTYNGGLAQDQLVITHAPIPGAFLLLGSGLVGLAAFRRRVNK